MQSKSQTQLWERGENLENSSSPVKMQLQQEIQMQQPAAKTISPTKEPTNQVNEYNDEQLMTDEDENVSTNENKNQHHQLLLAAKSDRQHGPVKMNNFQVRSKRVNSRSPVKRGLSGGRYDNKNKSRNSSQNNNQQQQQRTPPSKHQQNKNGERSHSQSVSTVEGHFSHRERRVVDLQQQYSPQDQDQDEEANEIHVVSATEMSQKQHQQLQENEDYSNQTNSGVAPERTNPHQQMLIQHESLASFSDAQQIIQPGPTTLDHEELTARLGCYADLKRIQEEVSLAYPAFPLQPHEYFATNQYQAVVQGAAQQIEFLYSQLKEQSLAASPLYHQNPTKNHRHGRKESISDFDQSTNHQHMGSLNQHQTTAFFNADKEAYERLILENANASNDIKLLRESLSKADDIVKNLRVENEYFQRQLEMLRRETERARQTEREMQQTLRARSDSHSQPRANSYHEAPVQLPQPVPHPQPILAMVDQSQQHHHQHHPHQMQSQSQMYDGGFGSGVSRRYGAGNGNSQTRQDSWGRQGGTGYDQYAADTNRSPVVSAHQPYRSPHGSKSQSAIGSRKFGAARNSTSGNNRSGVTKSRKQASNATTRRFGVQNTHQTRDTTFDENINQDTQITNLVSTANSSLEQEVRTLKFELQQQGEMLLLKTETVRNLQTQIESTKRRLLTDAQRKETDLSQANEQLQFELERVKDSEVRKEAMLNELQRQVSELVNTRAIEMNLHVTRPQLNSNFKNLQFVSNQQHKMMGPDGSNSKNQGNSERKRNGTGRNETNVDGTTNSKSAKNIQFAMDFNREMEMMFGADEPGFTLPPTHHQTSQQQNGKSARRQGAGGIGGTSRRTQKSNRQNNLQLPSTAADEVQVNQQMAFAQQLHTFALLQPENLLQNQIQAAQMAEKLIEEKILLEEESESRVTELNTTCDSLRVHAETMDTQRKELSDRIVKLNSDNDSLKQKFSALLDQFQEYVTSQETKQAEDQENQKAQQEQLLMSMQENIKELEQVTEGLQSELQHKEGVFELLKKENKDLEDQLTTKSQEESLAAQQAMRRLEDELSFLKRHHEIEVNMLKEQYERSLETAKLIAQETRNLHLNQPHSKHAKDLQSQQVHQKNDGRLHNQDNEDEQNYKSYAAAQQNAYMPHSSQIRGTSSKQSQRAKDLLSGTQGHFDTLKRDLQSKEQVIEEKNKEILKLRMQMEEFVAVKRGRTSRAHSRQRNDSEVLEQEQRGQIVKDLGYLVDQLRLELTKTKQDLFKSIGKNFNFDSGKQFVGGESTLIVSEEEFQSEIVIQMAELRALIALTNEVAMLASNAPVAGGQIGGRQTSPVRGNSQGATQNGSAYAVGINGTVLNSHDNNYQIKRQADQMLRQNHSSGLHELILGQISRSESLMADNGLMQRQLHKYETTLAELDIILRGEQRDKVIIELKKLVESQLKQIINLQRDCEVKIATAGGAVGNHHSAERINLSRVGQPLDGQEAENLRYQLEDQRNANEELISERRKLVEMVEKIEDQLKESQSALEKARRKSSESSLIAEEKQAEIEDIRKRVTKVAELFERKEIKQKYSFEVLCDFIHDKAKRLFSKYEALNKERKLHQEEKLFHFQRKFDQMEQENFGMKELQRQAERVIRELVPALSALLQHPIQQNHELSEYYYARQVLEQVEVEFRNLKKASNYQEAEKRVDSAFRNQGGAARTGSSQNRGSAARSPYHRSSHQITGGINTTGHPFQKSSAIETGSGAIMTTSHASNNFGQEVNLVQERSQQYGGVQTQIRDGRSPTTQNHLMSQNSTALQTIQGPNFAYPQPNQADANHNESSPIRNQPGQNDPIQMIPQH